MNVYTTIFVFIKWAIIFTGNTYNHNMTLKNYGIIFFFMKKNTLKKTKCKVSEISMNELTITSFGKCTSD